MTAAPTADPAAADACRAAVARAPTHPYHHDELREAPPGLDTDTMALWRAIDSMDAEFGREFVDALLAESVCLHPEHAPQAPAAAAAGDKRAHTEVPREWRGVPHGPHYRTLLRELLLWGGSGVFPLTFATGPLLPCCVTNDDGEFANEAGAHDVSAGAAARSLAVARAARERSPEAFRTALEKLTPLGVARLLGMRATAGSVANALPPGRAALAAAARARLGRKRGTRLSVAARALAKHCGRRPPGWRTCYWGDESVVMHGDELARNARADLVVERILDAAVWINVHHAPGGTRVLELRVHSGHGARWHAADGAFRGFLEPHSRELAVKKKELRKVRAAERDALHNPTHSSNHSPSPPPDPPLPVHSPPHPTQLAPNLENHPLPTPLHSQ